MDDHLPECPKSGCPACYEQGQRDALDAAVQRLEALFPWPNTWLRRVESIKAVRGDQP